MDIDFKKLEQGLVDEVGKAIKADVAALREFAAKVVLEQRGVLQRLAELRLLGKITDEELASELEDEKVTVQNLLMAQQVGAKAAAQKGANAAIMFLKSALLEIVKAAL